LYAYSIISLNATTGKLNWFYAAHNSSAGDLDFGATPNLFTITINGTTYDAVGDGSKDGYYYIVNRLNGNLLGKYLVGTAGPSQGIIGLSAFIYLKPNDPEIFIPSYYDSYNGCCGVVEALVPSNNTTEWRFYTHGNIRDSITLIPGTVLVGDNDGYLYAISASTGNQLLVRRFYDGISGGISAAGSYVIVPTSYSGVINETGVYALST
jgi:outer membrane protein assembly factor BamB